MLRQSIDGVMLLMHVLSIHLEAFGLICRRLFEIIFLYNLSLVIIVIFIVLLIQLLILFKQVIVIIECAIIVVLLI